MAAPKITDADFIKLFDELGPRKLADKIGSAAQGVYKRRRNIERKHNIVLSGPQPLEHFRAITAPGRLLLDCRDGVVLIGSDAHAWPGEPSTAFKAFIFFIKEMRPAAVIMNGDLIDGARISRHPATPNWAKTPELIEEIEAAQDLLHQIELAAPKRVPLFWPLGNHDARFSTRLATVAPEFAKIHGTQLKDHFGERWQPCWSVWINGKVVVKHRARGGVHASYNSTLHGGLTLIHGHTHSLQVRGHSDYTGRRYGVDVGMLSEVWSEKFAYLEDGVRNWASGFAVITFRDGELLQPELCMVHSPGVVEFRGERRTV